MNNKNKYAYNVKRVILSKFVWVFINDLHKLFQGAKKKDLNTAVIGHVFFKNTEMFCFDTHIYIQNICCPVPYTHAF